MTEILCFSAFLVALAILILYSLETAKPVTELQWSTILVDNVKNVQLSWKLPKNVDSLSLRVRINDDPVTATLPADSTAWQFPVNVGSKVEAVVVVTFDGQEAPSKPVNFVVPAAVEPVTELEWAVLPESDDSNEDLFAVDANEDGNVDYYLATKTPAAKTPAAKEPAPLQKQPVKLLVPDKPEVITPGIQRMIDAAVAKAVREKRT